ncbi:hypothetical protein L6R29_23080 [Myxococcota bacterium]|nr:hypothetical protein [Myxococcota bacterium]
MSAALQHHIQQLLEQEQRFINRHMAALLVLQQAADARPVFEDAFARSYEVRRGLESDMIDFQAQLNQIARSAGLPTHTRLLHLQQCQRPSEKAKERQAEQNRLIAIFFEQRTAHVSGDESLTVDLCTLFNLLETLADPPKEEPSRWVQLAKYVGASVAGAVAASVATWLWKIRQQAKAKELTPANEPKQLTEAA